MRRLIFGCGYLGERVARRWMASGNEVVVVTRFESRASEFHELGYATIVADVTRPETLQDLPAADTVLYAVGYDRAECASIERVYAGGLHNVLNALPAAADRLVYISTTGVYGPAAGDWVDERTPPDPQRDGGRASLAAEQVLGNHPLGTGSVILRLAGLYGPARVSFIGDLRVGNPIAAPQTGHLNLIHVDDAATVVTAAGQLAAFAGGPRIYCVSDGEPVVRSEFYQEVARQIGSPPPQFVDPDPSSPRALRAGADRRVRNELMLRDLNIQLAYPNYRAGLAAILDAKTQQGGQ